MSEKNTAVFGIYPSYANLESGVDGLKAAGFSNRDISVLFPESAGTRDFAHEKGTKAPEGATAGAGTGVVLGGALGWLARCGRSRDSRTRTVYRCRPDHGRSRGSRSWWHCPRHCRRPRGNGNSRVRGETLRGPCKKWRHPAFGPFQHLRRDEAGQANPGSNRRAGYFIDQ